MANIKSQTKRIQTNLKAEVHNFTFKASMRTAIKK
ncbi:MAG: 30S ribosomal protein S20, partial [Firmicutes bacterium]|nr:30S ribosomal protein S20 [Bacillota bacterium]